MIATRTITHTTFGSPMPTRVWSDPNSKYKYGFNGQEKDDEIAGAGNINTAMFWEYDTRLGRRWNKDPVMKEWESQYACFGNNPICLNDPYGLDAGQSKDKVKQGEGPAAVAKRNKMTLEKLVQLNPDVFKNYDKFENKSLYWKNLDKNWVIHPEQSLNVSYPNTNTKTSINESRNKKPIHFSIKTKKNEADATRIAPISGASKEVSQPQGKSIVDSNADALEHYFDGNGVAVDIGPNTVTKLLEREQFRTKQNRIFLGKTSSMNGSFSVDMTKSVFHVGRTIVNYSINCADGTCTVTYNLFVNDGFWDPDFIDEKVQGGLFGVEECQPDGLSPNLERFGGVPYSYIPTTIIYKFPNPGYK